MSETPERRELHRRAFLRLTATALAALPAAALAQVPASPATPPTSATPPAPAPPEHTGSEARRLTEVLRERYPDRFSETQWGSIVSDFEGDLASGKRLRAVKLANADEPDFTFRP